MNEEYSVEARKFQQDIPPPTPKPRDEGTPNFPAHIIRIELKHDARDCPVFFSTLEDGLEAMLVRLLLAQGARSWLFCFNDSPRPKIVRGCFLLYSR